MNLQEKLGGEWAQPQATGTAGRDSRLKHCAVKKRRCVSVPFSGPEILFRLGARLPSYYLDIP